MKIAICAKDNYYDGNVSKTIETTDYFAIYDHSTLNYTFIDTITKFNEEINNKLLNFLTNINVSVLLVPKINSSLVKQFDDRGIQLFQYEPNMSIKEALYEYFEKNLLKL